MFYVKLNEFDNMKKIENEKKEEIKQKNKLKNIYDYQQWQRDQKNQEMRHNLEISEMEKERLKEQWRRDKEADEMNEKEETPQEVPTESLLTLWKEGAESKKKLIEYMKTITDKNNPKYIPPESRIAVFDFDGTIFCETDTLYFDWLMYSYRILNDSSYKDKATEEQKQLAIDIKDAIFII